ncbi:hypothetical protein NONI108955_20900 [Nocardia ninae]|uniref:Uncharacterized protein n=1 Tax=Nocardia ninae NBRC 108245 TaxID=1210091 RepID=A0A511MA84_9NOCA|nr:hypothetical protein [Nocardia ninae]GEM37411.1 hypothetical protein NN4_19300 [Nocardia ninae NBRC 108245]
MKNTDIYVHPRTGAQVAVVTFTYKRDDGQKVHVSNVRVDAPLNGGVRKGIRKLGYRNVLEVSSYRYLTKREVDQTTVLRTEDSVATYARESLTKRSPGTVAADAFASGAVSARRYDRAKARRKNLAPSQITKGQVDAMARASVRAGIA